jgi:hypothetical protein
LPIARASILLYSAALPKKKRAGFCCSVIPGTFFAIEFAKHEIGKTEQVMLFVRE